MEYETGKLRDEFEYALNKAQSSSSCHQKYLKILQNYYYKVPFEDFIKDFFKYLNRIFHMEIDVQNPYVEKSLDFLAQFVSALTKPNENETEDESLEDEVSSHPFLTEVINKTLKIHDLTYVYTRYYACRFVTLILQHIGDETHLDNDICDLIQDCMLERTMDTKASIRLQAVMALVRLQDPSNADCPVIRAYLFLLVDANPLIRKEVVSKIAPNALTVPKISERIRDVDYKVRKAAFSRCADLGPQLFKIIMRQNILKCGLRDPNKQVQKVFMENLLPKWLSAYNDNFLEFLSGLKLDADENDIANTEEISKEVMDVFFRIIPIKNIIDALPLDDKKLIPLNNLSSEVIRYWKYVTNALRSSDETEEYLDDILPELTPFCIYIQSVIDSNTSKNMEDWEYLDHQYILYNLFEMTEQYDFSDEVGRCALRKLIMSVLQNHRIQFKVAKIVISLAAKLIPDVNTLTNEICQIISDIREPLVDKPVPQDEGINRNYQLAALKVQLNILQGQLEEAQERQEFEQAALIHKEVLEYKKKLADLNNQSQVVKIKLLKDDPETICRCLDLLIATLELPSVNIVTSSMAICKTEFLLPLLTSPIVEINWRVLKCLGLFCIIDKNVAEEYIKTLCIPIITYRVIPNYNKSALTESVSIISDLMRIYGIELFGNEDDTNNTTQQQNTTRRKLYRDEAVENLSVVDHNRMNVEIIIEIILDMLDDENEEIRGTAIRAISRLILNGFPVDPLLMSRLILIWFSPLTGIADACSSSRPAKRKLDNEKAADGIQQKLGILLGKYTELIKGAREVMRKAVIPTLTTIANAPKVSPLADIDIDNLLRFLAAVTNSDETTDVVHNHTNLAYLICDKIASKPKDPVVPHLTKMLLYLEISPENPVKELITQVELLLQEEENSLDKAPRKSVIRFVDKLKSLLKNENNISETGNDNENAIEQITDNTNNRLDDKDDAGENGNTDPRGNSINDERNITEECDCTEEDGNNIDDDRRKHRRITSDGQQNQIIQDKELRNNEYDELRQNGDNLEVIHNNVDKERNLVKEKDKTADTNKHTIFNANYETNLQKNSRKRQRTCLSGIDPIEEVSQQNNILNKISNKRHTANKVSKNNNISTDADSDSREGKESMRKRKLRNGIYKLVSDSNKDKGKDNKNHNHIAVRNRNNAKGKTIDNQSDTTDCEGDIDNMTKLRRSKRARKNLDKSDSSERSIENGKQNGLKNNKDNRIPNTRNIRSIQLRKSMPMNGITESSLFINSNLMPIAESSRNSFKSLEHLETRAYGVKRKKSRGKKSLNLNTTGDTTLHTILEQSQQIGILEDDCTISSNSTSQNSGSLSQSQNSSGTTRSQGSRVIIWDSSESESTSDSPSLRRSARKMRK